MNDAIQFGAPWSAWLLLIVPLGAALLFGAGYLRQRTRARFGTETTVRGLIAGRPEGFRAARGVLFLLGLACLVGALARPQYGSRTRTLRKRGIDVVVALDFSKSMLARDVRPSRIERAKAELTTFLSELDGDRVGVVAFAGETMEFPMTIDPSAAVLFFRELGPYDMPVGGTALGRALITSKRLLDRGAPVRAGGDEGPNAPRRSRVVILMTDGEDHEGDPLDAARELADAGIKVFTVGIGTSTGEPIPTYAPDGTWTGYQRDDDGNVVTTALTTEAESTLREVARLTGGRYLRAGRGSVGMEQVRVEMRRMRQDEQRGRRITVHEDRYAVLLLLGFLLIVLEGVLPEAWMRRTKGVAAG